MQMSAHRIAESLVSKNYITANYLSLVSNIQFLELF